jgi:hypothetical protein
VKILYAFVLFVSVPAWAGTLTVNLQKSPLDGSPGDMLTFQGTLINNTGLDLSINGAGINLASFDPSDTDLTDFILNATGPLPNGSSIGPVEFFTVSIPQPFTAGKYQGELTVQGGATAADDAVLGTANFEVDVMGAAPAATPEPRSSALTTAALLLLALSRWPRKRFSGSGPSGSPLGGR